MGCRAQVLWRSITTANPPVACELAILVVFYHCLLCPLTNCIGALRRAIGNYRHKDEVCLSLPEPALNQVLISEYVSGNVPAHTTFTDLLSYFLPDVSALD